MNKFVCSAVAAAALFAAGSAQAQPTDASATIRYADLNLQNESGLATLRGRTKAAADRLCGSASALSISEARAKDACRTQVFRSAEAQISAGRGFGVVEVTGTH